MTWNFRGISFDASAALQSLRLNAYSVGGETATAISAHNAAVDDLQTAFAAQRDAVATAAAAPSATACVAALASVDPGDVGGLIDDLTALWGDAVELAAAVHAAVAAPHSRGQVQAVANGQARAAEMVAEWRAAVAR